MRVPAEAATLVTKAVPMHAKKEKAVVTGLLAVKLDKAMQGGKMGPGRGRAGRRGSRGNGGSG